MKTYFKAASRAEFAHRTFGPYLAGSVLDVGSGGSASYFRQHLGRRYVAADVTSVRARPDVQCDFETAPLPFTDGQFDTVLCFDVLEHVDSPHRLFDECARVARRHVIVSLPNNWPGWFADFLGGHNVTHRHGYGLPSQEAPPGFRHKWFFNIEEGETFLRGRGEALGLTPIETRHVYERGNQSLLRFTPLARHGIPGYPTVLGIDNAMARRKGPALYLGFLLAKYGLATPVSWLEEIPKRLVWGLGRYRYANLFCRQLWMVLQRG